MGNRQELRPAVLGFTIAEIFKDKEVEGFICKRHNKSLVDKFTSNGVVRVCPICENIR